MSQIIIFFSHKGESYVGGAIKNIETGSTERAAAMIQKYTGAAMFQIVPVVEYSKDYSAYLEETKEDQRRNARPALKDDLPDAALYDVIYLGFPNFWDTMPMPVFTFLEKHDFSGRHIRPFCTHDGGGMGRSIQDIRTICPNAQIEKELALRSAYVHLAEKEIVNWLHVKQ